MLLVSFGGFSPWHRDVGWKQLPTSSQKFSSCSSCHVVQFSGGDPGGCGLVSLPLIFMKTLETRSTEHQHVYNLHISLCSIPHLSREEYLTLTPVSTTSKVGPVLLPPLSRSCGATYFHSCGNSSPWPRARPRVFNCEQFRQPRLHLRAGRGLHTRPDHTSEHTHHPDQNAISRHIINS